MSSTWCLLTHTPVATIFAELHLNTNVLICHIMLSERALPIEDGWGFYPGELVLSSTSVWVQSTGRGVLLLFRTSVWV